MDQPCYSMGERQNALVASILERSSSSGWNLLAAHVQTSHVDVILEAEVPPERVMNDLKSYASRYLNQLGLDESGRKRWARHGSTRWLWKLDNVLAAIRYVVDEQGERMAVFERTES
jgi:REP element-mobilizing transposase RayT